MMDGNNIPNPKVICTDVDKLTNVAKSAIDHALEVLKLLPTPIPADSKVYESLEAIRGVPLECSAKNNTDIGVQVDFINQDLETIIGEANTSDEYEIINITLDKHLDAENPMEITTKQDNVENFKKSHEVMETKHHGDASINPVQGQTVSKLQQSECDISNVETEHETDIENDTETISKTSINSNSTLTLENHSEQEDTLLNTDPNDTLDSSAEVEIPDELEKQDINHSSVTVTHPEIKIGSETNNTIENTTKQVKSNLKQSPETMTNEEKTPLNSTLEVKTSSIGNSILNLVKPKNYKPKPREDVKIFGNVEDVKKCLEIASKYMTEHKFDKAKRMAEKAERIHPTPAARALLEQIHIVTEAKEEAAERDKGFKLSFKERAIKEASLKATAEERAAKAAAEKAAREAARNVSNHKDSNPKINIENARKPSAAGSLKPNADPDSESPDSIKQRRAEGMMSVAQDAFSQGNMAKAEKLAKKAQKLNPSEETDKFLEKIRYKSSQINTEKKENADPNVMKKTSENLSASVMQSERIMTLLNKVKECLASGRLDDAEQALRDVRDCNPHPTEGVKSLESQIRAARVSRSFIENARIYYPDVTKSYPEVNPKDPKYRAKKNAESFIGIARNAMAAGDYEKAEKFLRKANAEYPSEISDKLLQDVQIELFSKDAKKQDENNDRFLENMAEAEGLYNQAENDTKYRAKKNAESFIGIARNAMAAGDYEKAEKFLRKANTEYPSEVSEKLLQDVQIELYSKDANKSINQNKNNDRFLENMAEAESLYNQAEKDTKYRAKKNAESFIGIARNAMAAGDYEKAEKFLRKANTEYPSEVSEKLLQDVQIELYSKDANKSINQNKNNDRFLENMAEAESLYNQAEKDTKYRAKKNAESFIGIARNAMAAGDYEKAEKFLRKANAEYPSEVSEKLLQDVQIELYSKDANKSINQNKNNDRILENIAESKKDFDEAMDLAVKSKKFANFAKVEVLKKDIIKARTFHQRSENNINTKTFDSNCNYFLDNVEKAESLYNQAKKELSKKNFDKAMDLAVKSQKLNKLAKVEVLKKDIIKARKLHEHSENNMNTNTFDGNCNDYVSKIDEAVGLLVQAKTEMEKKNLKKAEQLLVQSIEIQSTVSARELLQEIREFDPKHDRNTINYGPSPNHDEARQCIKIAEAAAKHKEFKKAEHFLEKSIRLSPTIEAKEMLENVKVYLHINKSHQSQYLSNDENITHADVEKCIEVAMNAISAEDFEKAERFLKKAERIHPTEKAKELLADVQEGLKQQKMQLANEEKAAPLVSLAMMAIDDEHYELAEILLTNACIKHTRLFRK